MFEGESYLVLETSRSDGSVVRVPMWFVIDSDRIYMRTDKNSRKVSRIRNDPRVRVAASDVRGTVRGEWVPASARIVPERTEDIGSKILAKYGLKKRMIDLFNIFRRTEVVAIELEPSRSNEV